MENYSFQNASIAAAKEISKPEKKSQGFNRDEIKKMVEKELGKGNHIVVPVLENGKYVFKRIN